MRLSNSFRRVGVHLAIAVTGAAISLSAQSQSAPASPTVRWEAVAAGKAPPAAAFKGGRQRMGGRNDERGNPVYESLPVCRGESNGVVAIGSAAPFYSHAGGWSWDVLNCNVFIGGK